MRGKTGFCLVQLFWLYDLYSSWWRNEVRTKGKIQKSLKFRERNYNTSRASPRRTRREDESRFTNFSGEERCIRHSRLSSRRDARRWPRLHRRSRRSYPIERLCSTALTGCLQPNRCAVECPGSCRWMEDLVGFAGSRRLAAKSATRRLRRTLLQDLASSFFDTSGTDLNFPGSWLGYKLDILAGFEHCVHGIDQIYYIYSISVVCFLWFGNFAVIRKVASCAVVDHSWSIWTCKIVAETRVYLLCILKALEILIILWNILLKSSADSSVYFLSTFSKNLFNC